MSLEKKTKYIFWGCHQIVLGLCIAVTATSCRSTNINERYKDRGIKEETEYGEMKIKDSTVNVFKLKNDMEVMLISNPQFQKSSAALAIEVGSFSDPDNALGMAHYLEHVLFLGNKEYPQLNELMNFVKKNGGYTNAFTEGTTTKFGFEIENNSFEKALSRFSATFHQPTFNAEFLEKEKNMVHSEYQKALLNDAFRFRAVSSHFVKLGHPASRFSIGSLKTLKQVDRQQVLDFYNSHYSSNLMKLVLLSPLNVTDMKAMAVKYFERIENKNLPQKEFSKEFYVENQGKMIVSKPVVDQNQLIVSFNTPSKPLETWHHKVNNLFVDILNNKGKGSLAANLKSEGLILEMNATSGRNETIINFVLPPDASHVVQSVLARLFNFIEFAKEHPISESIFEGLQTQRDRDFNQGQIESNFMVAMDITGKLMDYPGLRTFEKSLLITSFDPALYVENIRENYGMEKAHVHLVAMSVGGDQTEPYFNVQYGTQNLPPIEIDRNQWQSFSLPELGSYSPTDSSLVNKTKSISNTVVMEKPRGQLVTKVDTEQGEPNVALRVLINSEMEPNSKNLAKRNLYFAFRLVQVQVLVQKLQQANIQFKIERAHPMGIEFTLFGNYSSMERVLTDIFEGTAEVPAINQLGSDGLGFAALQKTIHMQGTSILKMGEPIAVLPILADNLLRNLGSVNQRMEILESLTVDEVQEFMKEYFAKSTISVFAYGNWKPELSENIYNAYFRAIGINPKGDFTPVANPLQKLSFQWPEKKGSFELVTQGSNSNNGIMQFWSFGPWTIENDTYGEVLKAILGNAFFDELRTRQNLGYAVDLSVALFGGQMGMRSLIQSDKKPHEIAEISKAFLKKYLAQKAQSLSAAEFEQYRRGILETLKKRPVNLSERGMTFFEIHKIFPPDYDYEKQKINQVESIDFKRFKGWMQDQVKNIDNQILVSYYSPSVEVIKSEQIQSFEDKDLGGLSWPSNNNYLLNSKSEKSEK